jgi:tether containing UBX domain for GLUT4
LEQTCTKFNFDVEEYDLKHHNKILDLSLMFRFSGVPNNATLEMVQVSTKRVEQNITICIQLEDGSRLNGDFPSSTTLKQIIEKLCPDKYESSPVVIYMRSEYHGESLINTSLRIMGLSSGGRALLRLINTDPESLKVQANVSANLPQKPREESPERSKKSAKIESSGSINVVNEIKKLKEVEKSEPMEITETTKSNEIVEKTEVKSTENIVEKMDVVESSSNNVESEEEDEQELIINYLDDRGTIIFSLDTMKSSNVEIPDSFFDLTSSEVRMLYTELKQQVDENENQPLMTAAMRQLEENKKILNQLAVYKTCTIRIQMPNRIVIQTKFKSIDKLEIVMDFLKQFLIDPNIDFHLCE